jgi:hypothetical protein
MIIKLHSFSVPVSIETKDIIAFVWMIELAKIALVIKGASKPLPIDEELWQLEELYQDNVDRKKRKAG